MIDATRMCEYAKRKRLLGLKPGPAVDAASLYLERRGLRFCVDFGTENALEMAFDFLEREWLQDHEVGI